MYLLYDFNHLGGDDRRVLLWRMEDTFSGATLVKPRPMLKQHASNIFCLAFNGTNTRVLSGGNDDTVIVHDLHS